MEQKILSLIFLLVFPLQNSTFCDFWRIPPETENRVEEIDYIISRMSDSELVGQVLMFGYQGANPSEDFVDLIKNQAIGGVKIFGWNTDKLDELAVDVAKMQRAALQTGESVPLFIATDQEGGWVRHVKGDTSILPGNMAIGATGMAYDSFTSASIIGAELKLLGINMNFAPTVDVFTNPNAHVIGPRSFSHDEQETSYLALAFYRGLEEQGVISTAKHFPGHGNANEDSHGVLPLIYDSMETVWNRDLLPYRVLIREGLPAIMSGHLGFPFIVDDKTPASLSSFFQQTVLRQQLGFEGIIITDDMHMQGVRANGLDVPTVCKMAIMAGNDMIMLSHPPETQQEVRDAFLQTIATDKTFKRRIVDSVRRILAIKARYLIQAGKEALIPDPDVVAGFFPSARGRAFALDLSYRSATMVRSNRLLPMDPDAECLLVGEHELFHQLTPEYIRNAEHFYLPPRGASEYEEKALLALVENYDYVVLCLSDEESLVVLQKLEHIADKLVVISVLNPVFITKAPWVQNVVALYSTGPESFQAGFAVIFGEINAGGRLPISIGQEGD